ncbi:hypothetical protein INT48_000789 [Thamnidium elegans]|uniref:Protein-S-isoprenylcysteine O-methyltransferase n=1 Tax=Thamnidium elegans TaxID=101142 RepID=A0A8H7W0U6_9FUNG|nr:hypothetical protein INT48_000789 [Thamnidium elegans]
MTTSGLNIRRMLHDEDESDPNIQLLQKPKIKKQNKDQIHIFDGRNTPQNISVYGFLLGMVCSGGIMFAILGNSDMPHFGIFLAALTLFHFLEYIATALFNSDKLSLDSYLINHSLHYHAAHTAALVEFLIEYYFFPSWKKFGWINYIGLLLLIMGQGCRTVAMFSARHNFSHHIVDYKESDHVLVKHGIYSIMRHPSYFGFYWWALGVQVLLMNPICFFLFLYWLQRFFSERIEYEEHTLHRFFGQEWLDYKAKTGEIIEYIIHLSCMIDKENNNQFHGWRYPEHNYVDLKSMALCCKHLYIVVAPFLWRHKEFILPREDDEKSENAMIQMATDILSKKALFQQEHYLGEYVRSLSRDLTNGPHYDLNNSKLMAQLVINLRALKIDFHPKARTEQYGLRYFIEYCPNLNELYLNNCRDTFDDFKSIYEFNPPLTSLTLIECTIKQVTLERIATQLVSLKNLLIQQVLIEPFTASKSNTHLIDTNQFIHPFHYQNINSTAIPTLLYQSLVKRNLSNLALTDSISSSLLQLIVQYSPNLEKLAIVLHELDPFHVNQSIQSISQLSSLTTLSLAFRRYYPLSKEYERLPCHVPTYTWSLFAKKLPLLKLLYISTTRLLVNKDFISTLLNTSKTLSNIIIHNIALVTATAQPIIEHQDEDEIRNTYLKESQSISYNILDWNTRDNLYTFDQAKQMGYHCFDESDQVCFIKGFM